MSKRIVSVRVVTEPDNDPDLSYLEQDHHEHVPEDAAKYLAQDAARLAEYGETWHMIGLFVEAEFEVDLPGGTVINKVQSGGLWGIESDSSREHVDGIIDDDITNMRELLLDLGFSEDEVDQALEDVER